MIILTFYVVIIAMVMTSTVVSMATVTEKKNGCQLFVDVYRNANENFSKHCDKLNETHYKCSSLEGISELPLTDDACIRLRENQRLNGVVSVQRLANIQFYSSPPKEMFIVKCNEGRNIASGFDFNNVDSISITNIQFQNCGHRKPSTVKLPATDENVSIATAFYFNDVTDLRISEVVITSSHGYAITMYNTYGAIVLDNVNVVNSQTIPFKSLKGQLVDGYSSGGGLYMEYNSLKTKDPPRISITNSEFVNNSADCWSPRPQAEGMKEGHIGFGRGGAFTLFFLTGVQNAYITMKNVIFDNNKAAWGGAVYARFRNSSGNTRIQIENAIFQRNEGRLSGGGVFITDTQQNDYNNTIHFTGCSFVQNLAEVGGGVAIKYMSGESIEKWHYSSIKNTNFTSNVAMIGMAVDLEKVPVVFTNIRIDNNEGTQASGQGAIYIYDCVLHFDGFAYFNNNSHTAIVTDCSILHLEEEMMFDRNVGENGGAISMYGTSQLVLYNSTKLTFRKNRAYRRGGAIYVQQSGPSIDHYVVHALDFEQCFIQFYDTSLKDAIQGSFQGSVLFKHNIAAINGDGIFVTSLTSCAVGPDIGDVLTKWKGFQFHPSHHEHIITRAVHIEVDRSEWKQSPGTLFTPHVILLDQRDNHVSEQINLDIWDNPKPECTVTVESNKRFIVTEDDTISLTLLGNNQPKNQCNYSLTISLAWNDFTSTSITDLSLEPCYFGYTFTPKINKCRCMTPKNRAKGIAYCDHDEIFFYPDRWADPNQSAFKEDKETTVPCPTGYCKKCEESFCIYNASSPQQCAPNRKQTSNICGSCLDGYSVALGSEHCVRCDGASKYNFIWILLLVFLFFLFIDVFIIWLGIDIYSNYLNGLLYYCQAVVLLPPSGFNFWQPIKTIIGILNMESTGNTFPPQCFIKGFNDLHKQFFNYTFPAIMLLILYVIGKLARRPGTTIAKYFASTNCLGAFTIISVIAYTDITRITFNLLNLSHIDPTSHKRWLWIHGDTEYFSKDHLPFAIPAILIAIFIVLGFPTVLVFSSKLVGLRFACNPFTQLTPIFGHFTYCFRKDRLHFASFYFFARVFMLGVTTFSAIGPFTSTVKAVICYVVCVLFAYNKPYKHVEMNWFDLFALVNLTTVAVLSLMIHGVSTQKQDTFEILMNLLILMPFVFVGGRMLWVYGKKCFRWTAKRFPKFPEPVSKEPGFHYPQRALLSSYDGYSGQSDGEDDVSNHSDSDLDLDVTPYGTEDMQTADHPYQSVD